MVTKISKEGKGLQPGKGIQKAPFKRPGGGPATGTGNGAGAQSESMRKGSKPKVMKKKKASVKAQIRGIERLLKRDLPDEVRAEQQARLQLSLIHI